MTEWYRKTPDNVLRELGSDPVNGLPTREAEARLSKYGPNELIESGLKSPWKILWEQFTATMVLILLAAAVVSGILGKTNETISIVAIVLLFTLLGFWQEFRAEKAMIALKKLSVPFVRVRRGGTLVELVSRELVPGDIIVLEAGNIVPADCRVIESVNLRVQESALTGESEAVGKISTPLHGEDLTIGDRVNMGYMGTIVTYGRGTAVVTETGMSAELGRIATMLQTTREEQTPMQVRLDKLGTNLAIGGIIMAIVTSVLGLLRGENLNDMFLTGISIAVAIVPEGLPAVVTFTLAIGARRMLKRHALIRRLPAVETLGSVTVICSDKTGTLTENRMTVVMLDVAGHQLNPRNPEEYTALSHNHRTAVDLMLIAGALCNDAQLKEDSEADHPEVIGDPTEAALLVVARRFSLQRDVLESALHRVAEAPFDSDRKRMTTVHDLHMTNAPSPADWTEIIRTVSNDAPRIAFTKGSVDGLMEVSSRVWFEGRILPMTPELLDRIRSSNNDLAARGMRVLGFAFRPLSADIPDETLAVGELAERDLVFIGFAGMIDPPRNEVKDAVATCRRAGIRPVMITGDHPLTARTIAQELGIAGDTRLLTGKELVTMSLEDLKDIVDDVGVFARVSPEHKLIIVGALQARGHVVAMTGDGVNDAPALKAADIGVSMGLTGTDVAKEASDMVLTDDNFGTIVAAVEEGRTIFDNVRRFIKFSIAGNIGKVGVMLLGPLSGYPMPLTPLQLLWLNLLTDGLLGLGMGMEPPERGNMDRLPIPRSASMFSNGGTRHIIMVGVLMTVLSLGIGYYYFSNGLSEWGTMVFTSLAFSQVGQAFAVRSMRDSAFTISMFTNKAFTVTVTATLALQLAVVYVPFFRNFFQTKPLSVIDLAVCLGCGVVVFAAIEIEKWWFKRNKTAEQQPSPESST